MKNKKFNSTLLLKAGLASLIAVDCAAVPRSDAVPGVNVEWEKCYGITKIGENDCSSLNGSHGCASKSPMDNDPNEYIWVPKDTCNRIVNGTTFESKKSKNKEVLSWCQKKISKPRRR